MILFYYHQSSRKHFTLKKTGVWAKVNKEQDNSELAEPVQQTA